MIFINNCAFLRRIHQIPAGARTVYISRIASSAREPAQTMESKLRTIAKAITWQALGLAVTGALAWFHTGNMVTALSFALSTAASGLAFFVLHERLWARVRWGIAERHV
jgi:uncharacterized membrane protein